MSVVLVNCQPFLFLLTSERREKNLKSLNGILEASGVMLNEIRSCLCMTGVQSALVPSRSLRWRKIFYIQIFHLPYCQYHSANNPEGNYLIMLTIFWKSCGHPWGLTPSASSRTKLVTQGLTVVPGYPWWCCIWLPEHLMRDRERHHCSWNTQHNWDRQLGSQPV